MERLLRGVEMRKGDRCLRVNSENGSFLNPNPKIILMRAIALHQANVNK